MLKACTAQVAVDSLCRLTQAFTQSTGVLQPVRYDRQRLPLILWLDEVCDETMRDSPLSNTIHFTTVPALLAVHQKAQVPPSIGHLD